MCGINGVYVADGTASADRMLVEAMTQSVVHRGPDGAGIYCDNLVVLGHRRLSIIDLDGGDQPIYNEDKTIAIVFNGEIYNYKELRQDLIKQGHKFATESDTEVIVHLYEERGTECLRDLNGMFAFALWDQQKQRLFIARDRFGEKPLYYHYYNGKLIFGSELKSLVCSQDIRKEIDLSSLDDYLAYGYVPSPRSIIRNVRKLPAAHYLVLENGNLREQRYWQPEITSDDHELDESIALEKLEYLLRDSVSLRLRSDVPVAAFLSGGIDSSLIVALAAQESSTKLTTFSVGFTEQDFNELGYAKLVADRYNTNHNEILLSDLDVTVFPRLVDHFDEPFADPSAIPTYFVTREAAKQVKVCLSGDGGDELFCGYRRYRRQFGDIVSRVMPSKSREYLFNRVAELVPDHVKGKGFLRRLGSSGAVHWQCTVGIFDSFERAGIWRQEYHKYIDKDALLLAPYFESGHISQTSRRMLADQMTYLTDDILVKVDRNSMLHSLEVRVPLLDHRIAEFANNLPLYLKNKGGVQKYLIKRVLSDLVPKSIIARKKSGFGLPIKYWLRDRLYEYSRELLCSRSTLSTEFFDTKYLEEIVERNRSSKRDLSRRVWALMWFEQWMRSSLHQGG